MERRSLRAAPWAIGALIAASLAVAPQSARAQLGGGICLPNPGSYTATYFPICDGNGNLKVNVAAGSVTDVLPYNGTIGQTLKTSSFAGVGGLDANGKFSPFLSSAFGVLSAEFCDQTGVTCATAGTFNGDNAGVAQGIFVNSNNGLFNGVGWDRARTAGVGNNVAATGVAANAVYGQFNTVLPTITSGNYSALQTDSSARLLTVGAGTAGTPSGGVVSVQGVASGTVLPANVSQIGGSALALGQAAMASSIPVVIASNQSNLAVTTVSGSNAVRIQDSGGNTLNGGSYGSDGVAPGALSTLWGTSEITALNPSGNIDRLRSDRNATGVLFATPGGVSTATISAATAGPTVIKNSAGRLARVLITTAGTTGTETLYDNASACSGTIIGVIPGTTAVSTATQGDVFILDMPASNGITGCGGTGSAAVTISYF